MIKMKKSDMVIAFSVVALILGSVLVGLASCENSITGLDLGGTPTLTLDTGPTTNGGYGAGAVPVAPSRSLLKPWC